ncbi:hypothetical protein ACGTNG_12635 [Halomonas sp. 1390]|uniref:hypothetical protein n=1 Tax=Halomonas sp. B23F22_3 TaxID=3459516 RepID=UPI00373F1F6A
MVDEHGFKKSDDGLDDNFKDKLLAIGKGVAGVCPYGGVVAEVVSSVIPGQRVDRITEYLRQLSLRVDAMDEQVKKEIARSPNKIDLVEEGGHQAARAISRNRIEMIVSAVERGLTEDEAEVLRRKRLLKLLGELDDDELALLNAYGQSYGGGAGEDNPFENVNMPHPPNLSSGPEEIDKYQLFQAGRDSLLRLKLLRKNYGNVKKGQLPEFDPREGDFKSRVEVSQLGRMLLKEIGMPSPFDQKQ